MLMETIIMQKTSVTKYLHGNRNSKFLDIINFIICGSHHKHVINYHEKNLENFMVNPFITLVYTYIWNNALNIILYCLEGISGEK